MSKLTILVFGTNQYYEPPQDLINGFLKTHPVENLSQKHESSLYFTYPSSSSWSIEVRMVFVRNLERTYEICKDADAIMVFVDLENVDTLDKMSNIVIYIKENCPREVKSFVIGKFNSSEDKIKSLNQQTMNDLLKNKDFLFGYTEICTEPRKNFDDLIETTLKQSLQNKFRLNKAKHMQSQADSKDDSSNSGCEIF